ncbi:MAG: hypothetical protein IPM29_17950 [Planctomycetes bacterium]|nr:hypothetical protein [Planctomycetota bacterium]
MPQLLADILKQVRAIWSRLDAGQRTIVFAVLLATVAGLGAIVWYAGRPDYEVVFRARDARELQLAQQSLSDSGVPFRVDGDRLLVDRALRDTAGSTLRAVDLDAPQIGDELSVLGNFALDSPSRAAVLERLTIQRVEASIRAMPGVESVSIQATRPPRSVYRALDDAQRPRATVMIELAPGEPFATVARAAIAQVSAGLGVPEQDVTAIDARTKQKLGGDGDALDAPLGLDDFLTRQEHLAEERRQRAQSLLDRLYPGRTLVAVSVELDPRWERRTEKIQPSRPAKVQEERTTDSSSRARPGGTPGGASGADGALTRVDDGSQETRSVTYEPWSGTRESGLLAPEIRSIDVALVIHSDLADQRRAIEDCVKSAVGRSSDGEATVRTIVDDFEVTAPLAGVLPAGPPDGGSAWPRVLALAPHAAEVLAVVIVLLFLRSLVRHSAPRRAPEARQPATVAVEALPADDPHAAERRHIERSIADDPAAFSRLVETWLAEQKP